MILIIGEEVFLPFIKAFVIFFHTLIIYGKHFCKFHVKHPQNFTFFYIHMSSRQDSVSIVHTKQSQLQYLLFYHANISSLTV